MDWEDHDNMINDKLKYFGTFWCILEMFSIYNFLLKGKNQDALNGCDFFWDMKMENVILVKHKNPETKTGTYFTPHLPNMKKNPVHNSKSKWCNNLPKYEIL